MKSKKKSQRKSPPAETGHDYRAGKKSGEDKRPEAPDGISGNWG